MATQKSVCDPEAENTEYDWTICWSSLLLSWHLICEVTMLLTILASRPVFRTAVMIDYLLLRGFKSRFRCERILLLCNLMRSGQKVRPSPTIHTGCEKVSSWWHFYARSIVLVQNSVFILLPLHHSKETLTQRQNFEHKSFTLNTHYSLTKILILVRQIKLYFSFSQNF